MFHDMSGNPLLGLTRKADKGLNVIEAEGGPIAPRSGLILERPTEGRCEERTILAAILPDRRLDVAASQRVRWFVVGSHFRCSEGLASVCFLRPDCRGRA